MYMVKPLPLLIITGLLAGCASAPEADEVDRSEAPHVLAVGCYQSGWQAETVPVLDKRGGPPVWDRYDFMPAVGPVACR